ncbi:hypothetical protein PILCRDRAFT_733284 [Piloderma croceum F 1598]|uniref:Uncharacterized protein n=1 Tax=Piloderma croceum (strain F 1598) TaxID=765440 RepID=A0A0C3AH58_PILCF|nr:hypothetical protein PILCRDRAFT_733284 [Piloderma croceum F 1598]
MQSSDSSMCETRKSSNAYATEGRLHTIRRHGGLTVIYSALWRLIANQVRAGVGGFEQVVALGSRDSLGSAVRWVISGEVVGVSSVLTLNGLFSSTSVLKPS